MKKSLFLSLLLALAGCSSNEKATPTQGAAPTSTPAAAVARPVVYTCSMHPEVVADKPGKCPKCGMDLVVKK